jgi:RRNA methyltransferase AviRa.
VNRLQYKYAVNDNYEDFASGRVLYHARGVPNFPVRLINEIYLRCLEYSNKKKDICLYDCCCGGGYSLTVLGFLNQQSISKIIASDIDYKMIEIAKLNLSLLSKEGIKRRIDEIHLYYEQFNKKSHRDAAESAIRLSKLIQKEIEVQIFQANALQPIQYDIKPDIIITDVPYGKLVDWQEGTDEINLLMESLSKICSNETVVAISMDKKQKINNMHFKRLEKQNVGKRRFEIYKLVK